METHTAIKSRGSISFSPYKKLKGNVKNILIVLLLWYSSMRRCLVCVIFFKQPEETLEFNSMHFSSI